MEKFSFSKCVWHQGISEMCVHLCAPVPFRCFINNCVFEAPIDFTAPIDFSSAQRFNNKKLLLDKCNRLQFFIHRKFHFVGKKIVREIDFGWSISKHVFPIKNVFNIFQANNMKIDSKYFRTKSHEFPTQILSIFCNLFNEWRKIVIVTMAKCY